MNEMPFDPRAFLHRIGGANPVESVSDIVVDGVVRPDLVAAVQPWLAMPAEACTELGADTRPPRMGLLRRLRVIWLQWQADCIADEREHYRALGWTGPAYLLESYRQQRVLLTRIRELREGRP